MRIRMNMLAPELRVPGALMRFIWPGYSKHRFKFCNFMLDTFGRGRAYTRRLTYRQVYLPRADGSRLRLCVYTPKECAGVAPGMLWMHGGGYAIGIPEHDIGYIRRCALAAGCVVVAPDYRRSTQAPYPAALEDCYLALLWLRDNASALGADTERLFVGGDSAGGGLTAALCLYARDRGEVAIAFQMPLYPMLDDRPTASSRDNDAPVWTTRSNRLAWRMYLGDAAASTVSPYAAPARATDYGNLPPALTFVGGVDAFRDETLRYVEALRAAGVPVRFMEYPGCFHGFDMLCFWSPIAHRAKAFMEEGLRYAAAHYRRKQPT